MKKIFSSIIILLQTVFLFSQTDMKIDLFDSILNKHIPSTEKETLIDNAYLIKDDSLYLVTVDFLWRIKNAHYIGAHIHIADSTVYVKILEPITNNGICGEKIKTGESYQMRLFRYYPFQLSHEIDYYHNYNLLFGKTIVSLQATDCLDYIFTTDNLHGLSYLDNNDSLCDDLSTEVRQFVYDNGIALQSFLAIIQKDEQKIRSLVDSCAVMNRQCKMAIPYSLVEHGNVHCLPPYKLKNQKQWFREKTDCLNLSDKLFFAMTNSYFDKCFFTEIFPSITINKIEVVYYQGKFVTYRLLWSSSLVSHSFCTYLSFKKYNNHIKLIGLSTI